MPPLGHSAPTGLLYPSVSWPLSAAVSSKSILGEVLATRQEVDTGPDAEAIRVCRKARIASLRIASHRTTKAVCRAGWHCRT